MKEKLIENAQLNVVQTFTEAVGNAESEVWVADVWRLDKMNLNGRIYSTALAERICAEGKKTMAYDGHDADFRSGHDFSPAIAYCDNPRIEEGMLRVDIHFLESQKDNESVRNIRELYKAGLPIGVSSVGYGSMDMGGNIGEDYELVRYLDFVSMPAALVYATPKSEDENKEEAEVQEQEPKEPVGNEGKAVAESIARAVKAYSKGNRR